jgi:DNA primase
MAAANIPHRREFNCRAEFQAVVDQIKRCISIPDLLHEFRWPIRHRKRADCGLCKGSSTGTVSYDDRLWHCHRCGAGGDVFSLVCAVRECEFKAAFEWLADYAHIDLPHKLTPAERRQLAEAERRRQEEETRARRMAKLKRSLRLDCRDYLHHFHAVADIIGKRLEGLREAQEIELRWSQLATYLDLSMEFDTAYCILNLAPDDVRTSFVLAAAAERQQMIRDLRGMKTPREFNAEEEFRRIEDKAMRESLDTLQQHPDLDEKLKNVFKSNGGASAIVTPENADYQDEPEAWPDPEPLGVELPPSASIQH